MINPYANFVITAFSDRLFSAISEAADSNPGVRKILEELDGRTIQFKFTDFKQSFSLRIEGDEVFQCDALDGEADLIVQGTLSAIIKAVFSENRNPSRLEGMEIFGDMKLAQRLYQIFENIDFDWEEELAKRTGDVPARHIGNLLRWGSENLIGNQSTLATKIRTSLTEEKQMLPNRNRVDKFADDVDTLQADLDRLDQRIDRLKRRFNK